MQPTDNLSKPTRLGAMSVAKVMALMLRGPCTAEQMHEVSGLTIITLHDYMRALRKEGAAHIYGWLEDATGRESVRVYKLGPGKDKPRRKKSKAQISRECRQRKREAREAALASKELADRVARAVMEKRQRIEREEAAECSSA